MSGRVSSTGLSDPRATIGTRLCEPTTRTMSEEIQERAEALRRMVETRDLIIADLEREIRELKAMLNGVPDPSWQYRG